MADHHHLVKSKAIFFGHRYDTVTDPKTGQSMQVTVREIFQYIPFLATLEMLLRNNEVRSQILDGHTSLDGRMRDFCDGQKFQMNPLFGNEKHAVQINLFFDELEVVNPLGSKTGIHKLGAFYFTLKNLVPKFNSSLENIFLLALCNCMGLASFATIYGRVT